MEAILQTGKQHSPVASSHTVGKNVSGLSVSHPLIQTKLKVNKPGDRFEQEADSVSDKVMRMEASSKPHFFNSQSNSGIAKKADSSNVYAVHPVINRSADLSLFSPSQIHRKNKPEDEKKIQLKKDVSHDKAYDVSDHTLSHIEPALKETKGSGQPLPAGTNSFMSNSMGADFSPVRVHTDTKATAMSKALNAHAFTHGNDIYFNSGMYNPESSTGKKLIAHELTHVVQQGAVNRIQRSTQQSISINSGENTAAIQRRSVMAIMAADPAFQGVVKKVKQTGKKAKVHEPTAKKVKEAQSAAKPPPNEKISKAKDKKVAEMDQQEPGNFDENKFKASLRAKIAALQLNTLKEAENFKANNGAAAVKGDAASQVSNEKKKAAGSIEGKVKEAPAPGSVQGKEVGAPPKAAPNIGAPPVNGAQASPKPVPPGDVSLQKGSQDLDKQMADAKVTEKQLAKSNEPKFTGALASKKTAQKDAVDRPQQFRKDEKGILTNAQLVATGLSKTKLASLVGSRKQKMGGVLLKQKEAQAKDEADRAKVAADIEAKFAATKTEVEAILSKLDTDVTAMFDQGINDATKGFEDYVDHEVYRYKVDRYLNRFGGSLLWAKDLLLGLPDEVNEIYKRGKDRYVKAMDIVINKVAKLVAAQLNAAKKRIAKGKQEIKTYVEGLPKNLQKIGANAAKNIQSKFSELEQSINDKQNDLVDSLAAKYKAGLENIDKKIAEMKEANKGLVSKAIGAIKDVINAIIEFKNLLLNILAKAAAAIELIIDDPIGFLKNLVAGVKQGIQAFMSRIGEHLKAGLMGWLFGTLASAGIEIPKTFDLRGIITLILSVLGLTYANIRARAVNIVGERVVAGLEKAAEIFIIIKNEGIGGLWKYIKDKVETLKETVLTSIKEFVIQKIVVAGITWLISLLNPASAFIKACKMIYDVIMFFITRGKQIMDLVNAVIDSVTAIAKGAIGVAATAVENALAKALPVAISFLASLLGLDGISEKIKAIIAKIQAPVNAVIDWVIKQAVALIKGIAGLFSGKDKEKDKDKKEDDEISKDVKGKVKKELNGKQVANSDEEKTLIATVYDKYAPLGLHTISFIPSKENAGEIDVIVSASLAEKVAKLNMSRPSEIAQLRSIAGSMSMYAKKTTIFVFYDTDKKQFAKITQKPPQPGHAEKFLKTRFPELLDLIKTNRKKLKTPADQPVPIHLDINRTPCDECADYASHIHQMVAMANQSSQESRVTISMSASSISSVSHPTTEKGIENLMKQGIEITGSNVWTEIKNQMVTSGIQEFEYKNRRYDMSLINEFIANEKEVQELVNKVAEKLNKNKPTPENKGK